MKSPSTLILASTSRYRRELLERLKIPFQIQGSGVDETHLPGESPKQLVARLARAKAQFIAMQHPDAWVIGSDQVAVLEEPAQQPRVLGKPGSAPKCMEQLSACSGRTLSFMTGVAVVRHRDASSTEFTDTTRVAFRALTRTAIERYVERESPLDCAGGFKSEGLGITLCESIDSADPTALIGLPLIRLAAVLREAGFELP